jgi:hypothetical protein
VHRITNIVESALEEKKFAPQSSWMWRKLLIRYGTWHKGLNYKLRTILPKQYAEILESYLAERFFMIKQGDAYSELKEIKAGAPQGSVLGPVLYLLYTCDLPVLESSTVATFTDDTAVLAIGNSNEESTEQLQTAINQIKNGQKMEHPA